MTLQWEIIRKNLNKLKNNSMKKTLLFIFVFFTFFSQLIYAQDLKRKGAFGITVYSAKDTTIVQPKSGIIVKTVTEGLTASALGIKSMDIILEINGEKVENSSSVSKIISKTRAGDKVTVILERGAEKITLNGEITGKFLEHYDNAEVFYDKTEFEGGYLRTIMVKPNKEGKIPVIFFMPGYTCMTLDNLGNHPYGQLFKGLVEKGYALMRVEKPGMGDCTGTPDCGDIDLNAEIKAFEKGYQKIFDYDFIDKDNIIIFGHSLGGIEAPVVAKSVNPKGVIVYGTGLFSWYEYLLEMFRFQNTKLGESFKDNEDKLRLYIPMLYEYLVNKKTPAELSKNEEYKKIMLADMEYDGGDKIWTRNYKYWQQIQDLNLTEYWSGLKSNVLVVWGEYDFEAFNKNEHKTIIDIVNNANPGKGTFTVLEKTDHAFAKYKTFDEEMEAKLNGNYYQYIISNFNTELINIIINWCDTIVK
jgi:uncharacterized protein